MSDTLTLDRLHFYAAARHIPTKKFISSASDTKKFTVISCFKKLKTKFHYAFCLSRQDVLNKKVNLVAIIRKFVSNFCPFKIGQMKKKSYNLSTIKMCVYAHCQIVQGACFNNGSLFSYWQAMKFYCMLQLSTPNFPLLENCLKRKKTKITINRCYSYFQRHLRLVQCWYERVGYLSLYNETNKFIQASELSRSICEMVCMAGNKLLVNFRHR